jgi:cytochrome c oxidase subunit 2
VVRRVVAVAGGLALIGSLGACSIDDAFHFGWPQGGITTDSQRMYDLWIGSTVAALAVGVFVWGLVFWCVVRYRKRGDELPTQTRYNLPMEMIYSVTPFLIISVLFYYTAIVQTDVTRLSDNPAVTVNVEAHKWNWEFSYEGVSTEDGDPVATVGTDATIAVLVLPTGRSIRFVEHSRDVIHSFWVPELLFKLDVFPGSVVNQFETTITEEGAYVGHCAEFCGVYHSMMNFELRAVAPDRFDAYLAARRAGDSTAQALTAIGEKPLAVTTQPFDTRRQAMSG